MIKLIVENGQITGIQCDTPQEAADYYRLTQGGRLPAHSVTPQHRPMSQGSFSIEHIPELHDFAKRIMKLPKTDVSSGTLADTLNIPIQGIGPRIRGLGKKYEGLTNQSFEDVIRREARHGEESLWHINRNALAKLLEID